MSCWEALTRKKFNDDSDTSSKLNRVLTLFDLTALGVGSTLGLGVYVLAGSVAFNTAGPGVVLSFLVAAVASAIAGLCYAEFAARVPKAGSAYVYSYVTIGEFVAFTIGWNLILEYVIGTSSVARGLSGYLDSLMDDVMSKTLREKLPIDVAFLAKYPDFFSFFMVLLLTSLLAYGVKESTILNNIFTCVNLLTVTTVLVFGGYYANTDNWKIAKSDIPEGKDGGEGGFLPFGMAGVMAGAAKCFYGFVGFDCVATTGEEALNPKRNIPLSICISLFIITFAYLSISTVLTMMLPFYDLNPNAPFPHAFEQLDMNIIKWIVTIGAIFALCTSLLGAMFPLPRVIYAMAEDGIIFRCLRSVNDFTKTPLIATILSGLLAATMTLMFDLEQLIDMMSIGTLLAYTIVGICVLILRYKDESLPTYELPIKCPVILKQLLNCNFIKEPNNLTAGITEICIVIFSIFAILLCTVLRIFTITLDNILPLILLSIIGVILLFLLLIICRQPVSKIELTFKVPCVPLLPCLSIIINLYLMFQLDVYTWIRFIIWIIIGYIIYFTYGIRKSQNSEKNLNNNEK